MKKLFYILLFISCLSKAQTPLFNVGKFTVTDYHAHYMCSVNITGFAASSFYYLTDRPVLSAFLGTVTSFAIGVAKEYAIDRNPSMMDLDGDGRGSIFGGVITFGALDKIHKKRIQLDTLQYQFNTYEKPFER